MASVAQHQIPQWCCVPQRSFRILAHAHDQLAILLEHIMRFASEASDCSSPLSPKVGYGLPCFRPAYYVHKRCRLPTLNFTADVADLRHGSSCWERCLEFSHFQVHSCQACEKQHTFCLITSFLAACFFLC